jgi:hypothetical protein
MIAKFKQFLFQAMPFCLIQASIGLMAVIFHKSSWLTLLFNLKEVYI